MFKSPPVFPNLRPVCPVDHLPDLLRDAVLYAIKEKSVPAAVALLDAVTAVAAVVHCGFDCVAPDEDRLPVTLNSCVVCPSAAGKGRSIKVFYKLFLAAHRKRRSRDGGPTDPPNRPRVEAMISSISFRELMEQIDGIGMSLTIQREEGYSFLQSGLFKHHPDALTQLWSGDPPLDYAVRDVDLSADDARVSIGFRIQPFLMYDYIRGPGRLAWKLGFWPRALAGCHDPELFPDNDNYKAPGGKYTDEAFQARMQTLAKQINDRRHVDSPPERTGVRLDVLAEAYLRELGYRMKDWKDGCYKDIHEAAGRAWENTLRLAVALHVFCGGSGKVSVDMVDCAWRIVEWSLSQARLIFVDAVSPRAVQPTGARSPMGNVPKSVKLPRPLQDAQWLLYCLDSLKAKLFMQEMSLNDVRMIAGLPSKRFTAALAWLKLENLVQTCKVGRTELIRRNPTDSFQSGRLLLPS
ncbi:MAG: DUF3987 domain-containing protein [Pseudoxanthomonas sp.]